MNQMLSTQSSDDVDESSKTQLYVIRVENPALKFIWTFEPRNYVYICLI